MKQYFTWFDKLNLREKRLVIAASVAVVIAIFYFGIWSPLNKSIAMQQNRLNAQQALLSWVEEKSTMAIQLRQSSSGSTFTGSLVQVVNQTTKQFNIAVSRTQPQGDDIQVWVDAAPFNSVLSWLEALDQQGVLILQADIIESQDPGIVQVRRLQLGKA